MTRPTKIAILGHTGMLGSTCLDFLSRQPNLTLTTFPRAVLDAASPTLTSSDLAYLLLDHDYCLNCIGVIKPRIDEASPASVEQAIRVNSLFPYLLARAAEQVGCRVLQIATDCVYSGRVGGHLESYPHDPTDVYGKTKSLGEVTSPAVSLLRCSIIGPEPEGRPKDSLLEWFLNQPAGSMLKGFTNHRWNGITTLAFAKICHGIIANEFTRFPLEHIVPGNAVTKAELLSHFAYFYNRDDVSIGEATAPNSIDRTLSTEWPCTNVALWQLAGYSIPPLIQQMIEEQAAWSRQAAEAVR